MEGVVEFKDWQKLDFSVGKILNVGDIEGADKLYKLEIDLGSEKRTLVAGLKPYYTIDQLKEKVVIVFTNLEPRTIRSVESKGMILAAVSEDRETVRLLKPDEDISLGSRVS